MHFFSLCFYTRNNSSQTDFSGQPLLKLRDLYTFGLPKMSSSMGSNNAILNRENPTQVILKNGDTRSAGSLLSWSFGGLWSLIWYKHPKLTKHDKESKLDLKNCTKQERPKRLSESFCIHFVRDVNWSKII